MQVYETLKDAIDDLTRKGYTFNFNTKSNCIQCVENSINIEPNEFEIDAVYRFQENSDPDDESVLYAISSEKYQLKGLLVNAFGIYADSTSAELADKLSQHKK